MSSDSFKNYVCYQQTFHLQIVCKCVCVCVYVYIYIYIGFDIK